MSLRRSKKRQRNERSMFASPLVAIAGFALAFSSTTIEAHAATAPLELSRLRSPSRHLQTEAQCLLSLVVRDSDRDDYITKTEFVNVVNQLSGNSFSGLTFDDLPCSLQTAFLNYADSGTESVDVSGTKPGQTASDEQDQRMNDFCLEVVENIDDDGEPCDDTVTESPGSSPTADVDCSALITLNACNTALSIADLSRDNSLSESEFVRLVNRLSGNEYSGYAFDDLPANFKSTFDDYASGGSIDVTGSKPSATATDEQEEFLLALCCETIVAIDNPGQPAASPTQAPATSPTSNDDDAVLDCTDTISQTQCNTAMSIADLSRDSLMSETEYIRFLNRLSSSEYSGYDYDELPANLQTNFEKYATTDGQVDLTGSKPGQSASDEQAAFLADFCCETDLTLDDPGQPAAAPTQAPATSPTGGNDDDGVVVDCSDTIAQTQCNTALSIADLSRDSLMNELEYVRFVNRLSSSAFDDFEYEELPNLLKSNYEKFATTDGEVDITGAKPGQTAGAEQSEFLAALCCETDLAIDRVLAPTPAPVETPTTPSPTVAKVPTPTLPPGFSEVYSAFVIANSYNIQADDLETGSNRQGLDEAYATFAADVVASASAVERKLRASNIRSRRLEVTYVEDSQEFYLLVDEDCPSGTTTAETCQTVYARFQVTVDDEDPQETSIEYTQTAQDLIIDGLLQEKLTQVDSRSPLRIVNASYPVTSTFPPTSAPVAPTPAPTRENSGGGDDGGGVGIGLIIGAALGGVLVCAGIGYLSTKFTGGRGKVTDDDDNYGGGKDDDDASDADRENVGGFGGLGGFGFGRDKDDSGKGSIENDDDNIFGDSKEKEKDSHDTKKGFGFGKKDKKQGNDQDNNFGLETNTFGTDADDNLELFNFDEPSVLREDDDQDGGSAKGETNAFGSNGSTGWGNSGDAGNFFGTGGGWGASGTGDGGADNFFATSAFGQEAPQADEPSGSESQSDEDSYTSSEDSTYQSDDVDEEEDDDEEDEPDDASESQSSADDVSSADESQSQSMSSGLRRKSEELDGMIEDGNWDGIAAAANSFTGSSLEDSSKRSSSRDKSLTGSEDEDSQSDSEVSGSASESTGTTRTEDREKRAEYRAQVDALVRLVLPDEVEKVDAMMEQFEGREAELVSTLQTMQERSATQRARAAVHKSKNRPQRRDVGYAMGAGTGGTEGAAEGTAAIAAASLPIPADDMFEEEDAKFGGEFEEETFGSRSYDDEEGSYYSDEGSRSHSGSGSRSRSYYSGDEGTYEGSRSRDSRGSGSYLSGEGSRSQYSDEGSRSHYSGEGSRSQYSGEGSRSQYSDEGSRSQYSDEGSRSQYSGEGSRSQYSDEGSQSRGSFTEGSRSRLSGDGSRSYEEGSRSQYSDEGSRSQYSDEGSRSQYSDEGSRSQYSGEGSRSQYSGEEGSRSQYSGEEGSRSQYSDEGSRSYYSGEEGSQSQYSDEYSNEQ